MNSQPVGGQSGWSTTSRESLFRQLRNSFRAAGVDTPDLDARVLVCAAIDITLEEFVARPDEPVDHQGNVRLDAFKSRRLQGEPVARILEMQEFWSREFALNEATLVPRPETELVVGAAIKWLGIRGSRSSNIADLGTGSGCILISILHQLPRANGVGIDISQDALRMARQNAIASEVSDRVEFIQGSWFESIEGKFDLVVSNPPYIPSTEIDGLERDVAAYDPRVALDGGEDGLDAYRAIAAGVGAILSPGAGLIVEIGLGQAQRVAAIMKSYGLMPANQEGGRHDLAGIERIMVFQIAQN